MAEIEERPGTRFAPAAPLLRFLCQNCKRHEMLHREGECLSWREARQARRRKA